LALLKTSIQVNWRNKRYFQDSQALQSWVCHYGTARNQVADRGTASNMRGSGEYIEKAFEDSRQGVVIQFRGQARC
jgi:hypothetical protein